MKLGLTRWLFFFTACRVSVSLLSMAASVYRLGIEGLFPEGFWQGRIAEFMHIKNIPVIFERALKLAADLQAALLH